MNLSPEIKQQLAEQKKQCIFCKLISGEIPNAKKVFEDDKTIALLDIYPAVKGHTLFMLKEHYPMPAYLSAEDFIHKFGLIPPLSKAINSAMIKTGINLFIAMGGAAGQQSYHFMIHLLPRENGDNFFNFLFKKKETVDQQTLKIYQQHFPTLMQNHFQKNPASWHSGSGTKPPFLKEVYDHADLIYEDEKVLCVAPHKSANKGHIIIYSKTEAKYLERLAPEDSAHLFSAVSLASTTVFEGSKAQGTNILLLSGSSDDNPAGDLAVHILPRWANDNLQGLLWEPKQPSYNTDEVAAKIKDKTWNVKFEKKNKTEIPTVTQNQEIQGLTNKPFNSVQEEIRQAIESIRNEFK